MSRDLDRNDASRNHAVHHGEQWSREEIEFLRAFWPEAKGYDEEAEVAEALGRTIEACRQRFYEDRWGRGVQVKTTTTTTTTTTSTYMGVQDDPDDQWWSPDYYK